LHYQAAGNPPVCEPSTAISNCFPGLEFDFKNVWRRIFVGLVMHEATNYVMEAEPPHEHLKGTWMVRVEDQPLLVEVHGPQRPGFDTHLVTPSNPSGVAFMEWSNVLAQVLHEKAGKKVRCYFTKTHHLYPPPVSPEELIEVELTLRPFFEEGPHGPLAVIKRELAEPGELTQGLCSPWQNDYRECACYYWAASRPDYVQVEPTAQGTSTGINWMQKERSPGAPQYVLDDRQDSRLVSYDDLFQAWQKNLHFQVGGRDATEVVTPGEKDDHRK
jgi:hypothetical protein